MLHRLYIHNYRCFENFELDLRQGTSLLVMGKNGTGKSSIGAVLEIFQKVARSQNRVKDLVTSKDLAWNRSNAPMVLEIEGEVAGSTFRYRIGLEYPESFRELRVTEELLVIDGKERLSRKLAQVSVPSNFTVDWHLVALPILRPQSSKDPALIIQDWLSQMIILEPIAPTLLGDSAGDSLFPTRHVDNLGDWFSAMQRRWPHTYGTVSDFLKPLLPNLKFIENRPFGREASSLFCHFETNDGREYELQFGMLSAGEKCYFIGAVAIAALTAYGPLLCYWDEVDSHLTLSEVGHFVMALRREARQGSQLLVTSHNPEAIRKFSDENTLLLSRGSHREPTRYRFLDEVTYDGPLIEALIRDDVAL